MHALRWWVRKLAIPEAMVAVGLIVAFWGNHVAEESAASVFWPTTSGTVLASRVEGTTWSESRSDRSAPASRKGKTSYGPYVQYEYRAQGQRYVREGVRLVTQLYGTAAEAQAIVERYPVGSHVQVFFDPGDPGTAVLESGAELESYVILFAGGTWTFVWACVLAVAVPVVYRREMRSAKRNNRAPPWR